MLHVWNSYDRLDYQNMDGTWPTIEKCNIFVRDSHDQCLEEIQN